MSLVRSSAIRLTVFLLLAFSVLAGIVFANTTVTLPTSESRYYQENMIRREGNSFYTYSGGSWRNLTSLIDSARLEAFEWSKKAGENGYRDTFFDTNFTEVDLWKYDSFGAWASTVLPESSLYFGFKSGSETLSLVAHPPISIRLVPLVFAPGAQVPPYEKMPVIRPPHSRAGNVEEANAENAVFQRSIDDTFAFVQAVKTAVKEGLAAGAISQSFEVYTGYSDNQVILGHPKNDGDTDGILSRRGTQFKIANTTSLKYSAQYVWHPFVGRLEGALTVESVMQLAPSVRVDSLQVNNGNIKLSAVLHDGYKRFVEGNSIERSFMEEFTPASRRVMEYKSLRVEPKYLLSYLYPVGVSSHYAISGGGEYSLSGVTLVENLLIGVHNLHLYKRDESGELVSVGDLYGFGDLTGRELAFYRRVTGNGGNEEKQGVIIPLVFQEAIDDGGVTYITGRRFKFRGNYASQSFQAGSVLADMFQIDTPVGGVSGARPLDFMFKDSSSYFFKMKFLETDGAEKGFLIYRNNKYLQDAGLISWLESTDARSRAGVKAEELLKRIKGVFSVESSMSYEEFKSIREFRDAMEYEGKSGVTLSVMLMLRVLGILLFVYSMLIIGAFMLDTTGFAGLSALKLITFGRLSIAESMYGERRTRSRWRISGKGLVIIVATIWILAIVLIEPMGIIGFIGSIFQWLQEATGR